jgi:hypothetical protein
MGHLRLGILPKTTNWNKLIGLLEENPNNSSSVANATLFASRNELDRLKRDPNIGYCFWLLTRITWSARQSDFLENLQQIGIGVTSSSSTFNFISAVSDHARKKFKEDEGSSVFREIALQSLKNTLSETTLDKANSLFGSTIDNVQDACKAYSSRKQFGILSRRFFSSFLKQFLKYFIDKEISNHIGSGRILENIQASNQFSESLSTYSWQSSKIMEDFAAGWYSKKNWETEGDITPEDAQKFVAVSLRKLQMEIGREEERV